MIERCKVCRKPVVLAERTVVAAFGRPLFVCHQACASAVQSGVAVVGRVALAAGAVALRKQSPKTLKAFEVLRSVIAERTGQPAAVSAPVVVDV